MLLFVATANPGKLREYAALFEGSPFDLVGARELDITLDVSETDDSYRANARAKALAGREASGLLTVADDSGIEVDALAGTPGPRSARFAGPGARDADNLRRLLTELEGIPPERRAARFRCLLVAALPDGREAWAEGVWEGRIAERPAGDDGFGYDPVFIDPELGLTAAQMPAEEKNRRSHRARAARALLPRLLALLARSPGFR